MDSVQTDNQPISTPPQPETSLVIPKVTPKKQKLTFILLGVLIAILIGVGVFFVLKPQKMTNVSNLPTTPQITISPTSILDETANWKTYKNNKYNYEIKFPSLWEYNRGQGNISDTELSNQRDIDIYIPNLPSGNPGTGVTIKVNELDAQGNSKNCTTLEECIEKSLSWLPKTQEIEEGETIFLGQQARTIKYTRITSLYSQTWKYVFVILNNNFYSISLSSETKDFDKNLLVFNKVLSTFKFLDQNSNNQTSNWQTYESKRFKFSFKYPQDLILDNQYENKYSDQGGINIYSKEDCAAIISQEPRGGGSFIELWVYSNPQNLSALDWMKQDTAHSNFNGQEYSTIKIDGETGYIYVTKGMGTGLEAILSKNGQIYMFADLGYDNELRQIISTFRFTQ